MKIGIIGLPGAGKSTIFESLTGTRKDPGHKVQDRIAAVGVPDPRLNALAEQINPKKVVPAQVTYFLPEIDPHQQERVYDRNIGSRIRDCEALIQVLRNFAVPGLSGPSPFEDFARLDQELMLNDLMVVENRIHRMAAEQQRGKTPSEEERTLFTACREYLEAGQPLRKVPELGSDPRLKGFALLSAKPVLALFNNDEADLQTPAPPSGEAFPEEVLTIQGKIEQELAYMEAAEAREFLSAFEIQEPAANRVIQSSYALLGCLSFFTVLSDEVRAWTLRRGESILEAAGVVHTDMKKGFIRAEVISCEDLLAAGSFPEARKRGLVRLEGKAYTVQDGDVVQIRFNI